MKTWTVVNLILLGIALFTWRAADRPGDDFGIGILAWLLVAVAMVSSIIEAAVALFRFIAAIRGG